MYHVALVDRALPFAASGHDGQEAFRSGAAISLVPAGGGARAVVGNVVLPVSIHQLTRQPDNFTLRLLTTDDPDRPSALHAVLNVPFKSADRPDAQVIDLLEAESIGVLDLSICVGAFRDDQLHGAALIAASPGRAGLALYGNRTAFHGPGNAATATMAALANARRTSLDQGLVLIQSMCDAGDSVTREGLEASGFAFLTTLHYLVLMLDTEHEALTRSPKESPGMLKQGYSWVGYRDSLESQFRDALEQSYEASLDCPELTGLRDSRDVLLTHRARTNFDPSLWYLLRRDDATAGVLLLNRVGPPLGIEIVYIGVPRRFRGQGISDALLRQAITAASRLGARFITLAVDCRNDFARRMYARWNYRETLKRDAFIATSSIR